MKFYDIPDSLPDEITDFENTIARYIQGELNPVQFRAIRVPFGVYEQRKDNTYMVRVRCPAGGILPNQLAKISEIANQYASGVIHITTRQEIQIHDVLIEDIITIMRELLSVSLSSRGGGGNTVRNITACQFAALSHA